MALLQESLDLDFSPADAARLVPVELDSPDRSILKTYYRKTLPFSPAPHPIVPAKAVQYTDTTLDGDGFNLRDLAKDLERHDGRCRPGFPIRAIGVEGSLLGAFSPDS